MRPVEVLTVTREGRTVVITTEDGVSSFHGRTAAEAMANAAVYLDAVFGALDALNPAGADVKDLPRCRK